MPLRLISPTVGLSPASPFAEEGQTTDPSVSVPTPATQRFAETAAPVPELDPQGLRSRAYGLRVSPPRPVHPLVEGRDRCLPPSLRLVLPRITAPALRNCAARKASAGGRDPSRASDPAVVFM